MTVTVDLFWILLGLAFIQSGIIALLSWGFRTANTNADSALFVSMIICSLVDLIMVIISLGFLIP